MDTKLTFRQFEFQVVDVKCKTFDTNCKHDALYISLYEYTKEFSHLYEVIWKVSNFNMKIAALVNKS